MRQWCESWRAGLAALLTLFLPPNNLTSCAVRIRLFLNKHTKHADLRAPVLESWTRPDETRRDQTRPDQAGDSDIKHQASRSVKASRGLADRLGSTGWGSGFWMNDLQHRRGGHRDSRLIDHQSMLEGQAVAR
ncbi:hypothetical protein EDB81DRAFT_770714 [Dactylonectria macrodidyma]|uniref:Secreted protein n=1 Tax=Dactylonectria macrodidyma TaxID=307937 RepID=A0A9P9FUR4_9HYPO|nr:hypothetical protein EDB81DRAFT_770714 [Dactylonectria macrodidyma]